MPPPKASAWQDTTARLPDCLADVTSAACQAAGSQGRPASRPTYRKSSLYKGSIRVEEGSSLTAHQPPGRIHGRVVDTATGQPVADASVRIRDDLAIVDLQRTNQRGEFMSRLLFAGAYVVEAEHEGRVAAADGVVVRLAETTNVELRLPG